MTALFKRVGNVLEKDQAKNYVLVFGSLKVFPALVCSKPIAQPLAVWEPR